MDEEKQKKLAKVIRNYSGFLDWTDEVASDIAELSMRVVCPYPADQHTFNLRLASTAMNICNHYSKTGQIFFQSIGKFKTGPKITLETNWDIIKKIHLSRTNGFFYVLLFWN